MREVKRQTARGKSQEMMVASEASKSMTRPEIACGEGMQQKNNYPWEPKRLTSLMAARTSQRKTAALGTCQRETVTPEVTVVTA